MPSHRPRPARESSPASKVERSEGAYLKNPIAKQEMLTETEALNAISLLATMIKIGRQTLGAVGEGHADGSLEES